MKQKTDKKSKTVKTNVNILHACFVFVLVTLSIFNISFYFYSQPKTQYVKRSASIESKIVLWQSFLDSHPTYFEGWIELARLYLTNGNVQAARNSLYKAQGINPNSEKLVFLEKQIEDN